MDERTVDTNGDASGGICLESVIEGEVETVFDLSPDCSDKAANEEDVTDTGAASNGFKNVAVGMVAALRFNGRFDRFATLEDEKELTEFRDSECA
jgi:hypothetical protein